MELIRNIPAYGMPEHGTAGTLPEIPPMCPPPMPEGGAPMPPPDPAGVNRNQASPPGTDPALDEHAVPGSDVDRSLGAGPGFPGGGPPKTPPFLRVESLDIIDGEYIPCQEPYAEISGTVTGHALSGVTYRTDRPCLNGLYIGGDSDVEIRDSEFVLSGHGINDFAGIGTGIMADGTSQVQIKHTSIRTSGAIRPCLAANENAVMHLRDCELYAAGGPLPEGYVPRIGAGMMEPPSGLGIGGTCRASVLLGGAKMYFDRCRITAEGWGALSTDSDAPGKYLECNDSEITVTGSGYGIFGDGSVECVMNRCRFRVKDYLSMAGASSTIRYQDCDLDSGRYGAMVFGSGAFRVPQTYFQGGSIRAAEAAVYLKGTNAYVSMDGVAVQTGKYLIHTIVDDDKMQEVLTDAQCFQTYGMKCALRNMTFTGDIVHEEIRRDLAVAMEHVHMTGEILNAYLSMKESTWFATADSIVAFVGEPDVSALDAPEGVTIHARAAEGCKLNGTYPLKSGGILAIM